MTDESLRRFLERFREFTIEIEARKKRGQNDFNPLLCVQKIDDEENMHSGFLYALLNPYGEHYQDDLFLKLFVKSIGLQEWFGSTSGAEVYKEKKRIDIHITNGARHIIVENKINARDQGTQIARYIEAIAEVDSSDGVESNERESSVEYENIAVVYLAPYIKNPTQQSLGKWKIQGESLVDSENNKVRFKAISYENEIIDWLESALNEAGGISNLRMAIECYTDVVKRLTGQKENTMDLQAFFHKEGNEQFLDIALELVARKDEVLRAYFKETIKAIENIIKNDQEYKTKCSDDVLDIWHNDFDEVKLKFYIYAYYDDHKNHKVLLSVCLNGDEYDMDQTPAMLIKLKKVLCVDDNAFDTGIFDPKKQTKIFIDLAQANRIDLIDFTQEKFIEFFESVKDKVYQFNQKIADDLAKPDSKLREFLLDKN